MINLIGRYAALALAFAMASCGGGGGASGGGDSLFSNSTSGSGSSSSSSSGSGSSNVTTSTSGSVVMTLSSTTISASNPGTVSALVKDANGQPLTNTMVTFAVTSGAATVSPIRVLTNSSGIAATALVPVSGQTGADYVSASADVASSTTLTSRVAFTVSPVTVALTSISAAPTTVPAYGATVVTVGVSGASAATPVTVNFASTCAGNGRATLSPTSVVVTGSTTQTTYQDKGCSTTDRVSAVINGTSQQQQVDLAVSAPAAQSLEFVSASPEAICLAGSGCSATSVVSFRLKDQFGNAVAQQDVTFALDVPNVATLSFGSAKTNDSGIAQVSVSALAVPSPVRVRATVVAGSSTLTTVSNALSINAGLPVQRSFSFSATKYNVDGWAKDGEESEIRLQLSDRFSNPVPDGTVINVVAEGASVIPAYCTTVSGVCRVKFVSSNFRPANGRITVVAYAQGEETFTDQDGDNLYTLAADGSNFQDLGQVYVDKNENGTLETGEYLVGSVADGVWSANTFVRYPAVITLSDSSRGPRLFDYNTSDCRSSTTSLTGMTLSPTTSSCRIQRAFCMRDANTDADALGGNSVPAGATLSLTTNAQGVNVSVDNSPIASTVTSPTLHIVTAELQDCSKALTAGGMVDLTVTMPAGQKYTMQIGVIQ